jgi:hypothetical protein
MLWLLVGLAAAVSSPSPDPAGICPQIERRPVARYADFPRLVRDWEGRLAERDAPFNSTDVIRTGDDRALARFVAGGDMGGGRWLVVHESAGRFLFHHVDVWRLKPDGGIEHPVHFSGGNLDKLCAEAAAKLAF